MKNELILVNKENSEVGEGPLWDSRTETLLFLNIRGKCIWKVNSEIRQNEKIMLPQQVGCMAVCENGDILVALEDAVYRIYSIPSLQPDFAEVSYAVLSGQTLMKRNVYLKSTAVCPTIRKAVSLREKPKQVKENV